MPVSAGRESLRESPIKQHDFLMQTLLGTYITLLPSDLLKAHQLDATPYRPAVSTHHGLPYLRARVNGYHCLTVPLSPWRYRHLDRPALAAALWLLRRCRQERYPELSRRHFATNNSQRAMRGYSQAQRDSRLRQRGIRVLLVARSDHVATSANDWDRERGFPGRA